MNKQAEITKTAQQATRLIDRYSSIIQKGDSENNLADLVKVVDKISGQNQ